MRLSNAQGLKRKCPGNDVFSVWAAGEDFYKYNVNISEGKWSDVRQFCSKMNLYGHGMAVLISPAEHNLGC